MGTRWKRWWPLIKLLLAVVVLVAVGWSFAGDLLNPKLWEHSFQPAWLLPSGVLYLLGLGCWCLYWRRLLVRLGQQPPAGALLRAYYVSHLGKYVPGKAWTLLLRAMLLQGPTVRGGIAAMTATYEVLTTMASGALVVTIGLLLAFGRDTSSGLDWDGFWAVLTFRPAEQVVLGRWTAIALTLLLLAVVGLPLLPPVFNRLAEGLSRPFRGKDPEPLPRVTIGALLEGLAITSVGWVFLAGSFWMGLQAATDGQLPWSPDVVGRMTAGMIIAYVAAFVVLFAPGGLGVREYLMTLLVLPELLEVLPQERDSGRGVVVLAVLAVRLTWTVAELLTAGCLMLAWFLSRPRRTQA